MNEDNFKVSKPNTQKNSTGDGIAIIVVAIIIAAIVGTSPNSDNSVQPNKPRLRKQRMHNTWNRGHFKSTALPSNYSAQNNGKKIRPKSGPKKF